MYITVSVFHQTKDIKC